ncbi:MAG: tRNA pseudouridine(38-40) synthase TruA [Rhodospirillaceae bacterium]|nr:tRNA pseudouridine(38-40) synthase TruA [Rhodospirillaceae bacterium]
MPRFKLTIEYDGTPFVGWQRQDNGPSVQAAVESALKAYCQADIIVYTAGRTDAGVHALGQVAHADIPRGDSEDVVANALNAHLRPNPIAVLKATRVADDFHARFSALERRYEYRIVNRRAPLALDRDRAWWLPMTLDAQAMHAAAQKLVGKHDFTSFRAAECQADSPVRTLDELSVARRGEEIVIQARARSFLHHQVRNIVGTLKFVGEGKWTADDVAAALAARDRAKAGPTAPAAGLYLVGVRYPGD